MHTGLQINIEAGCTRVFTLFFTLLHEEVHFNKEKRTGRFYAYGSHEQQLSVWQRKNKRRMTVLFVHDFFSII